MTHSPQLPPAYPKIHLAIDSYDYEQSESGNYLTPEYQGAAVPYSAHYRLPAHRMPQ